MESNDQQIATGRGKAARGDGAAAWELGTRYRTGDGVPQNMAAACRWFRRGADLGDREAQNDLGTMLLRGLGCTVDRTQAISWYRRSAEQGCADAQWNLGKRYLHGDGVDVDYAAAYAWLSKAAAQAHTAALCDVGSMHGRGHGVRRNLLAAADFHLIAAEKGDQLACDNLAEYRSELEGMALSGSQMASLFLCRMHNRGHGALKSQSLTWEWIRWAQIRCVPDPDNNIVEEVKEAYEFYDGCIPSDERRRGERALSALRGAQRKRTRKERLH